MILFGEFFQNGREAEMPEYKGLEYRNPEPEASPDKLGCVCVR